MVENAPDFSKSTLDTIMINGPTAGLVYSDNSLEKDGSGMNRINYNLVKYVKEDAAWKVDVIAQTSRLIDGVKKKPGLFDITSLSEDCQIDGIVRKCPEPASIPEISAFLDIFSYGYKTSVTLNSIDQGTVDNKSSSGYAKGGIRKGENTIVIHIERTDKNVQIKPIVKVRRIFPDKRTEECFSFEAEKDSVGSHSASFTIK